MITNRLVLLGILLVSTLSFAEPNTPVEIEYKVFYSHLRKLDPEKFEALQFAFGFIKHNASAMCPLSKVTIHTPKKDIEVEIATSNRFTLPKERALKLADATVLLNFDTDDAADCDMSVLLQANPEWINSELNAEQIRYLNSQFKTFFESMGASLFSFLMPETKGLKLHLKPEFKNHHFSESHYKSIERKGDLLLVGDSWISDNQQVLPLMAISHITAWIE